MIQTERLKIYTVSDDEMKKLIAEETDDEMRTAYQEMLEGCISHPEQRNWYAVWFMELNGKRIGDLCFKGLRADGVVEIGYGTYPGFESKGYMTEAVMALVQWASRQPGVLCIEAETDRDNKASQRVLEKSGFVPSRRNWRRRAPVCMGWEEKMRMAGFKLNLRIWTMISGTAGLSSLRILKRPSEYPVRI